MRRLGLMGGPALRGTIPALELALERRLDCWQAMAALEAAVLSPAVDPRVWAGGVVAAMIRLRDTFDAHVDVAERPGGLFDDVLARAPRLGHAVAGLRAEHAALDRAIGAAVRQVLVTAPDFVAVRHGARCLLDGLSGHRRRGADLVFEAYEVDIGEQD